MTFPRLLLLRLLHTCSNFKSENKIYFARLQKNVKSLRLMTITTKPFGRRWWWWWWPGKSRRQNFKKMKLQEAEGGLDRQPAMPCRAAAQKLRRWWWKSTFLHDMTWLTARRKDKRTTRLGNSLPTVWGKRVPSDKITLPPTDRLSWSKWHISFKDFT